MKNLTYKESAAPAAPTSPPTGGPTSRGHAAPNLMKTTADIRAEIDAIDDQIVDLYLRRLKMADEIAETKKASGKAIFNPARER